MASKYVELEGTMEWAKVFEHNRDLEGYKGAFKNTNGRTTLNLIIDKEQYDKLQLSGSMKRPKVTQDGRYNVKFDRKWETGRDWDSGEPAIYRADGNPWDVAVDGEIGNGSYGRVLVVVTPFPDLGVTSTRLEKIKVLDHVTFEGREDPFSKDETGSHSSPAPVAKEPAPAVAELDDEIPF